MSIHAFDLSSAVFAALLGEYVDRLEEIEQAVSELDGGERLTMAIHKPGKVFVLNPKPEDFTEVDVGPLVLEDIRALKNKMYGLREQLTAVYLPPQ